VSANTLSVSSTTDWPPTAGNHHCDGVVVPGELSSPLPIHECSPEQARGIQSPIVSLWGPSHPWAEALAPTQPMNHRNTKRQQWIFPHLRQGPATTALDAMSTRPPSSWPMHDWGLPHHGQCECECHPNCHLSYLYEPQVSTLVSIPHLLNLLQMYINVPYQLSKHYIDLSTYKINIIWFLCIALVSMSAFYSLKRAKSCHIVQLEPQNEAKVMQSIAQILPNDVEFCKIFKAILMRPWNLEYSEKLVYWPHNAKFCITDTKFS